MEVGAVILMVVTILVVWGGLVASIVALQLLPTPESIPEEEPVGAMTD